jgi:hypothetical protein
VRISDGICWFYLLDNKKHMMQEYNLRVAIYSYDDDWWTS